MSFHTERQAHSRLRELVHSAMSAVEGQSSLCYDGPDNVMAHSLGLDVTEVFLPPGVDGAYAPGPPARIAISTAISDPERRNFTFFHEVSHHLIRGDAELYSYLNELPRTNDTDFIQTLESYCNVGAAEFLLPAITVTEMIHRNGFNIQLVRDLDAMCHASKPAIALQLAHCAGHRCFVVVCAYGLLPVAPSGQLAFAEAPASRRCLHTVYAAGSPSARYPIGRFVPVPDDHPIGEAFRLRQTVRGTGFIPFRSGNRTWMCDCEAFYYAGRAYAVFNVTPPTPLEQLSFFDDAAILS